jgi:6-phosphogluconate dehydrogenase
MKADQCEIGMVGLGVMGRNLLLNMADLGHSVAGYDKAQRDYFGAHTYERIDAKGTFHTEWEKE